MNMRTERIKKTFQIAYHSLADLELKEIYLYLKLNMYSGSTRGYNKKFLRSNAAGVEEMTEPTFDKCRKALVAKGYIYVAMEKKDNGSFYNTYHILERIEESKFEAVANDFLNLTSLTANEKGFAVLLAFMKEIPTSYYAIAKATGVDQKACKRYMQHLTEAGVLVDNKLNTAYFPNLAEEANQKDYEKKVSDLRQLDGNSKIQKQLDWLDSLEAPYHRKLHILQIIEAGLLAKPKPETNTPYIYML